MDKIIIEIDTGERHNDKQLLDMLMTLCSYTDGLMFTKEEDVQNLSTSHNID